MSGARNDTISIPIVGFRSGTSTTPELKSALDSAWAELKADPEKASRAADVLGMEVTKFEELPEAPVRLIVPRAGFSAQEVAVIAVTWIASEVLLDALKDLAKDAIKAKARQLWDELLLPALRAKLPRQSSLGREVELKLEGQDERS